MSDRLTLRLTWFPATVERRRRRQRRRLISEAAVMAFYGLAALVIAAPPEPAPGLLVHADEPAREAPVFPGAGSG